jgi:hypothetical protein
MKWKGNIKRGTSTSFQLQKKEIINKNENIKRMRICEKVKLQGMKLSLTEVFEEVGTNEALSSTWQTEIRDRA